MKANKKEEGFALVTVLLFVLIILLIGTAAIALANNDVLISAKHKEEMQAFYAAEAGLTAAVEKVKKDVVIPPPPSPPLGEIVDIVSDPQENPSYPASYEVESSWEEEGEEGEKIRLTSTGYVGSKDDYQAKAVVSALLSYKLQPAFEYAFFGPVFSFGNVNKWNISGKIYTHDVLIIPNMGNNDTINATFYFFGNQDQVTIDNSWTVEEYDKRWVLTDKWNNYIAIEFMDSPLPMPEVDAEALRRKTHPDDQTYYSGNQNFTSWEIDFKDKPVRFIDGNLTINAGLIYSGRGIVAATGKINLEGPDNHKGEIKAKEENDTSSRLILISFAESNPAIYINDFNLLNAIFFAPKGKIELVQNPNSGIIINGALIGEDIEIPGDQGEKITINYDPSLYFTNGGIPLGIGQWQMEKWEQLP